MRARGHWAQPSADRPSGQRLEARPESMAHRPEASWTALPGEPALDPKEVHVVRVGLDLEPAGASRLLSAEEGKRAAALRSAEHRRRFEAAHAWLRAVLGRYLIIEPQSVQFELGRHGKPGLAAPPLRFNLSHSGQVALIALAWGREVGVDIEQVKPGRDVVALARRTLEPGAGAELEALNPEDRLGAFHQMWARHEARLKCLGTGLSAPPQAAPVQIFDLHAAHEYAAAVAVEGEGAVALGLFCLGP
jgi:4'-phosphopantetheinyl transferase